MIASKPTIIFDPYAEISRIGESSFTYTYSKGNVVFEIMYDGPSDKDYRLKLEFDSVVMFDIVSFPGVSSIKVEYDKLMLGSLVEYSVSSYRDAWQKHFGFSSFRHFSILLLNENKNVNIVCNSVNIKVL